MVFLLASLHRDRYRQLVAETGGELPPEPFTIACPKCGDLCIADLGPDDEPQALELQEWAALVRLDAECPDHAHRVAVCP
jgi:hypothetical protein